MVVLASSAAHDTSGHLLLLCCLFLFVWRGLLLCWSERKHDAAGRVVVSRVARVVVTQRLLVLLLLYDRGVALEMLFGEVEGCSSCRVVVIVVACCCYYV
jgi:low temperature requirement protein LtrA